MRNLFHRSKVLQYFCRLSLHETNGDLSSSSDVFMSIMADDSWLLREDGYINIDTPTSSIIYHPNLNVILLSSVSGQVHILDVNSGGILQSSSLSGLGNKPVNIQYLPGSDRIVFCDENGLGVRSDYNGVLLLHTALQQPLKSSKPDQIVKIELFLSEAVLLYQCLQSIELMSVECSGEVVKALGDAIENANRQTVKGIKAQKWCTICLELPHLSLKLVASNIVSELKRHSRHVPALAIASALYQRIYDLMPSPPGSSKIDVSDRELMYSEAARRETFKKWPHMDYKWALPAQMAQAGFFHQPTTNGDDRAMCFNCCVCLVCWEKTDEPWSEHERHSSKCALVKGEYTHNVPLSVTNATSPAYPYPNVSVISRGNSGDIFLTGTNEGCVSIWNVDCKLKAQQEFTITMEEPFLQNIYFGPYSSVRNAWDEDFDRENDYSVNLSALAIVGRCQNKDQPCSKNVPISSANEECRVRPTIVCGVNIQNSRTINKSTSNIWSVSKDSSVVKAMNDQNQAKSSSFSNSCYLLVFDFQGKCAHTVSPLTNGNGCVSLKSTSGKSGGSKKCGGVSNPNCRTQDSNLYDDIYLSKFMCLEDDSELSPALAFVESLNDQGLDIKSLVSSSKDDIKFLQSENSNKNNSSNSKGTPHLAQSIEIISNVKNSFKISHKPLLGPSDLLEDSFNLEGNSSSKTITIDASESLLKKIGDEMDAKMMDLGKDQEYNVHNHLADIYHPGSIPDILYKYKDSGIKMKVPYSKPSTTKTVSVKLTSNDSTESEVAIAEDAPPPACVAVQCLTFPNTISSRTDLSVTHVIPTNDGDHILIILSSNPISDTQPHLVNGYHNDIDIGSENTANFDLNDTAESCVDQKPTSYLLLYSLSYESVSTLINEVPMHVREMTYEETPLEVCLLPNLDGNIPRIGLAATVARDGALRLINIEDLSILAETKVESLSFKSVAFCSSLEKLCVSSEKGAMYFYAIRDSEGDSTEECDEDDITSENCLGQQGAHGGSQDQPQPSTNQSNLIVQKTSLNTEDLENLTQLAGIGGKGDNIVAYSAVVPSCWCELLPAQRPRSDNQNISRTWRLQNTASTWDEHVLELTLPWSLSIAQVELKFALHSPCPTPPNIQVTLLKQHLRGIGHRKESKHFSRVDDHINFNLIDLDQKGPVENPVRSAEYLRAHNAEILAGPLILTQGLDLSQHSGTLTLTSPKLFKARGRTLLLHIKTLFDPSKEINQGRIAKRGKENSDPMFALPGSTVERFASPFTSKKVEFYIGCDWLHEISITVRSNKHTHIPQERLQRIAMLESNNFIENLLNIATTNSDRNAQSMALDLLVWVVSIRLARFRNAKTEIIIENEDFNAMNDNENACSIDKDKKSVPSFKSDIEPQQYECVKIIQQNVKSLVKNCILLSKRSIAKKCIKLILICSEGAKKMDEETSSQFEAAVMKSVIFCMPLIGGVNSAGSLRWFTQLAMRIAPLDKDMKCASFCIHILKEIAVIMKDRVNPYHLVLRSRFGLYGLPMESSIFDVEPPVLGKTSSVTLSYASIVAGDIINQITNTQQEVDLRDLYNHTGKGSNAGWWWQEASGANGISGLSEVMALKVSCHSVSDGMMLETATQNANDTTPSNDHTQFFETMGLKEFMEFVRNSEAEKSAKNAPTMEMNQNDTNADCSLMECEVGWNQAEEILKSQIQDNENDSPFKYKDSFRHNNMSVPWQQLVQQPPQQTLIIKRMHSGSRHFVVLDFGYPVRLTDLIIPSCPELIMLTIHIWLHNEEQDSVKLVQVPDILAKDLIMTDIQPPPLCRYLKISTIGRYNISTTRCKIPLGWFFGEIAETGFAPEGQINTLTSLHQDLTCRFRLAVGKLTDCLDPYLDSSGGNASHMTAYLEGSVDSRVRASYQECLELQQQMNTVEKIMERFKENTSLDLIDESNFDDLRKHPPINLLKQSSTDKLRSIAEALTDILLFICFECENSSFKRLQVTITMPWCDLMVRWLVVMGGNAGPRLQAALASVLTKLCCTKPWWGAFLADTVATLYTPQNTLIFPQDRVLILLVYMGRKSLWRGGVVECVSRLVSELLPTPNIHPLSSSLSHNYWQNPIWQTTDLSLLSWSLIYLSSLLDTAQPKESSSHSWSRWDFLSGNNGSSSSNSNNSGNNSNAGRAGGPAARLHRRKLHKRIFNHRLEELEAVRKAFQVQALSALSSQAASQEYAVEVNNIKVPDKVFKPTQPIKQHWVKRFEDFLQDRISVLNKRVSSGSGRGSSTSGSASREDTPTSSDMRLPQIVPQSLALQLSRRLIHLILSMDFTCNTDLLLLACKVVGRLCNVCGGLPNMIQEHEVLGLLKAACSPSAWHQHAIQSLLQDLVDYDRRKWRGPTLPPSMLPLIQTETPDGTIQWHTAQNVPISFAHDLNNEPVEGDSSTPQPLETTSSGSSELLPAFIESDDSDMENLLDEISEWCRPTGSRNAAKPPRKPAPNTTNGASLAIDARMESGIEVSAEVLIRRLSLLGGGALASAIHAPPLPPIPSGVLNLLGQGPSTSSTPQPSTSQASPTPPPTPSYICTTPAPSSIPGSSASNNANNINNASNASSSSSVPSSASSSDASNSPPPRELISMLKRSFHLLFVDLETQDDSGHLERVLQMWVTLSGSSWGISNFKSPSDCLLVSEIKLSRAAVETLIHALNQQTNISLRCWVLAFQCLSWMSSTVSDDGKTPLDIATVIIEDDQFADMIVKFLSSSFFNDYICNGSEKQCVGPVACATFCSLLNRVVDISTSKGRSTMLHWVKTLTGPSGAIRAATGPLDAQKELLKFAIEHVYPYTNEHMAEAISVVENAAFIAQSVSCTSGLDSYGMIESSSGVVSSESSSGVGGILAKALADSARFSKPPDRKELVVAVMNFATGLISMPIRTDSPQDPAPETMEQSLEESQTDESKASQQTGDGLNNSSSSASSNQPCLADKVLQLYPTMKRILKTLSVCSTPNFSVISMGLQSDNLENCTVGDALFKFALVLTNSASHPSLVLGHFLEFVANDNGNLSEALVCLFLRHLVNDAALQCWVSMGGCEALSQRLVASYRSAPGPRSSLVASLHTHLKSGSGQSANLANLSDKNPPADPVDGLINYAPFSSINSSNPSAQVADVLLGATSNGTGGAGGTSGGTAGCTTVGGAGGSGPTHRRARSAAWSHHFCKTEGSVDLAIKLPHAILLHEVQLQPHLSTLSSCPSAVSLEVCVQGCVMAPLGPPQPTAGMTFIRLKLIEPQVVTSLLIRLYRPRDSRNMGLLLLKVLGTPAFSIPSIDKLEEKIASTCIGWVRLLVACFRGNREARQRCVNTELAEAAAGLLLGGAAPPSITGSLLRALGSEPQGTINVLDLILWNAHVPNHHVYQYSSQNLVNKNSAVEAACDLLYHLCTLQDDYTLHRIKRFIYWLKDCGDNAIAQAEKRNNDANNMSTPSNSSYNTKHLSSAYIQCLSSVLWAAKEHSSQNDLESLITVELFDIVYKWIAILPKDSAIKKALDSVMCSICYIRPELFTMMLQKMGVLTLDTRLSSSSSVNVEASISDDSKDSSVMQGMTDDTKVYCVPSHQSLKPTPLEKLALSPAQLMTIASAAMSPDAVKILMNSLLPHNVAQAIEQFCLSQCQQDKSYSSLSMTDSDKVNTRKSFSKNLYPESGLVTLEMMPVLIDWLSCLCIDNDIKTWLGECNGSCFWTTLLLMLCLPQPQTNVWQKNESYTQLEERTIRFFGAVMTCHPVNQQLFASTLYNIISLHPEMAPGVGAPIGGFARGLLLRLVLRGERITVGVRGPSGKNPPTAKTPSIPSPPSLPAHPSLRGRTLLTMPLHSKLSDVITQTTFGGNVWANSDSNLGKKLNVIYRGGSMDSGGQEADPWGLTVAAANTAKDKRSKELRNFCAKTGMIPKKKSSLGTPKKEDQPSGSTSNANNSQDSWSLNIMKVFVDGLDGPVAVNTSLGTLCAVTEHKFGPSLNLTMIPQPHNDAWSENSLEGIAPRATLLGIFANAGGLALLARHLPPTTPSPSPAPPPLQPTHSIANNGDTDWVKLDDIYEDVGETSGNTTSEETTNSVPTHSLIALGLLLRLPGYAEALLKEGQRAVYLLRLLLGVTDDGEGKDILSVCGPGLGTLAFRVLVSLLDSSPLHTDDGRLLRGTLLRSGSLRLLLACLAVFTHQQPDSPPQEGSSGNGSTSKAKAEEKSKLYWAKGTGFGTGSTQQSWNVEQSLMRQKTEEEHVTVLLQVIASFIQPGEQWGRRLSESSENESSAASSPTPIISQTPPNQTPSTSSSSTSFTPPLPLEVTHMLQRSALLPAISSYLRNDSVLDMSRHIPLYLAVMRVVRAIMSSGALWESGGTSSSTSTTSISQLPPSLQAIPPLLQQMSKTVDTYATKLKMNKKTIYGKNSFSQRFTATSTNITSDGGEDDEGLAMLIPDIQATSALVQARLGLNEEGTALSLPIPRIPSAATREARYLEVMKRLQFETFEMITECTENGYKFTVPYHFESSVRAAGERCHPARMKRLAQEAVTLSTSLPLSYSSSVFVRTDQDRLDIMKVLITGPSDTPYANGCFELDVYFPVEYPNTPMLINLETTGRHSVRFNPNLYLDGKVCLSVLNTWHGRPEEQWNAQTSSFLQVLVSIQSLILVPEPYFNEPGFERSRGTPSGTHHSLEYNSNIYQACVRWAMLEQLRNPTTCFKQVIQTHFWLKRDEICSVIEDWISELELHSGDKRTHRNICVNAIALKRHYRSLREELAKLPCPPGLEELDTPFSAMPETPPPPASSSTPLSGETQDLNSSQPIVDVEQDHDMETIVKQYCQ